MSLALESLSESPALALPPNYSLVWSDEFAGTGLPDPKRWRFDTEFNSRGWHNNEAQYYSSRRRRNARMENGRLVIEARRERLPKRDDWGGQDFSSARLITKDRADWRYGFFEVRARMPCVRGAWPAIWMLPADRSPDFVNGEIDIMEHVGHRPLDILQSVQTGCNNHRRGSPIAVTTRVEDACGTFRNYQLHWTRSHLSLGIDGVERLRYVRKNQTDWPFDRPFYLILNVAVGGTMGGAEGIKMEAFPAAMEVEWVRVYQRS